MKAKIVYVVTSDETDFYLEQTLLSVFSLRKHNPDAYVELVVDHNTNETIAGKRGEILKYIDNKVAVNVPKEYNKKETSRFLKTNVREYVNGDILFIDSDTIITDKLDEIDLFDGDIGAVINNHVPISKYYNNYATLVRRRAKQEGWKCTDEVQYFNSGVLYVKDTEKARHFCSEWHLTWKKFVKEYGRYYDQAPLAFVNEKYNYVIKELSGQWNCQVLRMGLPYLHQAKIIHYFASNGDNRLVYIFGNPMIYHIIREKGFITRDIIDYVNNAKSAFVNPTRLCTPKELNFLSGEMARACLRYQKITKILNSLFSYAEIVRQNVNKFKHCIQDLLW